MQSKLIFMSHVAVFLLTATASRVATQHDEMALLQKPDISVTKAADPYLVSLRRESVPVRRKGEIVSHKTSYSGVVSIGVGDQPPQEFRVVFDTGSGHVVLPSAECKSESCLVHRQYNMSQSSSATAINVDGSLVPEGETCDQVKIGFGTGSVLGEFVKDTVCLGSASEDGTDSHRLCSELHVVMAVEMSTSPFKNFGFDGILGLGLKVLALNEDFSFFDMVTRGKHVSTPHFGVFLTDGEHEGETSEIAFGGHNPARLREPLKWSPVAKPELGYWLIDIKAFRIGGVEMDFCKDGSCRGVVDTGTSHLGVPSPHDRGIAQLLTQDAADLADCRGVTAPTIELEVEGLNITLDAENYMRTLPLKAGISVGSSKGVTLPTDGATTTTMPPSLVREDGSSVERYCRPRLMPVNLPAPVGPHLFILGEPVLQKYYTVFDWKGLNIGMGVSSSKQNMKTQASTMPVEDSIVLVQVKITVKSRRAKPARV